MNKKPIALQLYSIRDLTEKDFVGALELVAELGYEGVEFAGYGGLSSAEMLEHLNRLNLKAVSSHVSFDRLRDHLDEEISYNKAIGNTHLVCPAPPRGFEDTAENWRKLAQDLTEIGKRAAEQGVKIGYHNHSFEFKEFDGIYALDIFYAEADPDYVFAEIDLGWTLHGGVNPAEYLRKFAGRCPLVHIKDFDQGNEQKDVGTGILDLPAVLKASEDVGVQWLILETEVYPISSTESVKVGLANLKAAQNK